MGFTMRGDKNSLALLSSKRVKAFSRTRADEAFALPSFSDAMPAPTMEPPRTSNTAAKAQPEQHVAKPEQHHVEHDSKNVKQTMLQHESVFKEQLHELHRLYQKQCVLMESSQKGHACHPRSEPPYSNSSSLYNPDSFKPQEDRSFEDISVAKVSESDGFPIRMVDVKPFGVDAAHQIQGCGRPMLDLEQCAEGLPMLDLECPPKDRPIFDLECPADEYMDVKVGKKQSQALGLMCTMVDASAIGTGENRDLLPGKNVDSSVREKSDIHTGFERNDADSMCLDAYGSKERMCKGYSQPGDFGHQFSDFKENCHSRMGPSLKTLDWSHQEFVSRPLEAASASGLFRGLPDLNGHLSPSDNQAPVVKRKPEKNVNDGWYINIQEADLSAPNRTSKLPHWLVQPPPKSSRMSVPMNIPAQTSEWQQMTACFPPQMHHSSQVQGMHTYAGEIMKTPNMQEIYHPWLHNETNSQQREIPFKEPLSLPSSQFFSGASTGAGQWSYDGAHTSGLANETIPSFLPYVRDNDKRGISTVSGVSSAHSMEKQDIVFDTRAASMELLSRISSRETSTSSPVLPWYQQKETFSSLMHQASNPESPFHGSLHTSFVNPWGVTSSHCQVLPIKGIDSVERGVYGMHSFNNNFDVPWLVERSESLTKDPVFDFMSSRSKHGCTQDLSMKGNAATSWKHGEKPFYTEQIAEQTSSYNNNDCNLGPSRNAFDLNVSSESSPMEENFDVCYFTDSRCHMNQKQEFKKECKTISSTDWDILSGNKLLSLNEEQKGLDLRASDFADRVTNIRTASEGSSKDATQSPNDTALITRAGMFCSQRGRSGNDTCADNCSGEDGGGFVEVKSSDASGLTSCESRDAAHLELTKVRDDSNTSGEACQSHESRIPCQKEDVALSSYVRSKNSSGNGLVESQQCGSVLFSTTQSAPGFDAKGDCSMLICTEFGDESEAANSIARKESEAADNIVREHSMELTKVAELLLSLGCDLPPVAEEGYAISDEGKSLDWLVNIIPQEEKCIERILDVDMVDMAMHEGGSSEHGVGEKVKDAFELAVLALKPIDPDAECLRTWDMERGSLVGICSSLPNFRRRSSRRGKSGKDFQREMLRSMSSLSRHEITEDLQIIEGLIKSTTESSNSCMLFLEDKPSSSPDSGFQKKARGTKAYRGRKLSGMLNVCSWGESTRRKRMGRQRSQWLCLPPGVQSSPLVNNMDDGLV